MSTLYSRLLAGLFGALLLYFGVYAILSPSFAAGTATPILPQTVRAYKVQILNATGTAAVSLAAAATNGTKINSIVCTNTDTAAYTVTLSVLRSAVTYVLATFSVPLSSGNTAAALPLSVLTTALIPGLPLDGDGNPYLFLESTDTLQIASGTTVTNGKAVSCHTVAADF